MFKHQGEPVPFWAWPLLKVAAAIGEIAYWMGRVVEELYGR